MPNLQSLDQMPKAAKQSFLQSAVTAIQTQIAALPEGGAKNDAVLELAANQYLLKQAR